MQQAYQKPFISLSLIMVFSLYILQQLALALPVAGEFQLTQLPPSWCRVREITYLVMVSKVTQCFVGSKHVLSYAGKVFGRQRKCDSRRRQRHPFCLKYQLLQDHSFQSSMDLEHASSQKVINGWIVSVRHVVPWTRCISHVGFDQVKGEGISPW